MVLRKEIQKALTDYLIEYGYPENSIAVDWPIGKSKADLVVIDIFTDELLAVFELVISKSDEDETGPIEHLRRCFYTLRNTKVKTFLVYSNEGIPPFEIRRVKFIPDDND